MTERELIRHVVATLAYRGGKALRGAKPGFATFDAGEGRTPLVILAHVGDLLEWSLTHLRGEPRWSQAAPGAWDDEVARFHARLADVDAELASDAPLRCEPTRLLQGPIVDALTHVGQLMMLRRMSGDPAGGENYFLASIEAGRVGPDQAPPRRSF